jgi:hypothetical protein
MIHLVRLLVVICTVHYTPVTPFANQNQRSVPVGWQRCHKPGCRSQENQAFSWKTERKSMA